MYIFIRIYLGSPRDIKIITTIFNDSTQRYHYTFPLPLYISSLHTRNASRNALRAIVLSYCKPREYKQPTNRHALRTNGACVAAGREKKHRGSHSNLFSSRTRNPQFFHPSNIHFSGRKKMAIHAFYPFISLLLELYSAELSHRAFVNTKPRKPLFLFEGQIKGDASKFSYRSYKE